MPRPELFFENMLAYQAEPKEERLENCRLAVKNCYLLGMPEYRQEVFTGTYVRKLLS